MNKRIRPSLTPEGREKQMIALAIDCAEKQLMDGTASAQVITHYLKLGSSKEALEQELMQQQKELMIAKTEAIHSAKRVEEMYKEAFNRLTPHFKNVVTEFEEKFGNKILNNGNLTKKDV